VRGVLRPVAVRAPAVASVALAGLFTLLSHTTGSGWLVVMAAGLVPLLLVGAFAPVVPLLRARPALGLPRDGTVGRALSMDVSIAASVRGLQLRVGEPATDWVRVDGPVTGTLRGVPARRGVVGEVLVELRSAAPFGFVSWRRVIAVPVAPALEVGPAPITVRARLAGSEAVDEVAAGASARVGGDVVRGIRPYAAGDPFRLVHWPATARSGHVMVRELDVEVPPRLVLVVDLRPPRDPDGWDPEVVASRAAGLVLDALGAGRAVVLSTAEPAGPVTGPVASATGAGRRLARAVAGPPGDPVVGADDVVVRLRADGPALSATVHP
jgi:uncharacterized protein (DUF58 family)